MSDSTKQISLSQEEMRLIVRAMEEAAAMLKPESSQGKTINTLLAKLEGELMWWNAGK
jgi:hypothetical protein